MDGVGLKEETGNETDAENGPAFPVNEVVRGDQQDSSSTDHADNDGFEPSQCVGYPAVVSKFLEKDADPQDDQKRRENNGGCGGQGAEKTAEGGIPQLLKYRVADVGCAVDADRAGGHLGEGNNICKLRGGYPLVDHYDFVLDQRQHGVAASKGKETDDEKGREQFKKNHRLSVVLWRVHAV